MDGIVTAGIVIASVGGFSIPTYLALFKTNNKLGNHEARLNSIEKKLDKINGNLNGKK